jgi:hypothetical protein
MSSSSSVVSEQREVSGAARPGGSAAVGEKADARRSLSIADHLTLFVIGLVVVLVSLPRLRRFAVRENENDAIQALRLLSADAADHPEVLDAGGLAALLAASARHQSRLEDVELLDGGRLRRHGYLFDAVESSGGWMLRAWPWEHGRTGLGVFVATAEGLVGSPNSEGRWSGPLAPPPAALPPFAAPSAAAAGWVAISR